MAIDVTARQKEFIKSRREIELDIDLKNKYFLPVP